jgi:charged multivesicular body protein 4
VDGELGCGNPFRRNIDGIENAIDEADEQTENMRQTQEALARPVGASADFDEVPILS